MFNMTPEMRDFLLHMGGGLLMGGRNNAEALGRGLLMGAQGRNEGMVLRDRQKSNEQDRQRQQMQMDEMARAQAEQEKIRGIFSQNYMPGNLAPNDDMGNPMPPAPQGMNMQGLLGGLEGAGPQGFAMAQSMRPRPEAPLVLSKGARAFRGGQEIASNPEAPSSPFGKINPADYTPESFRKFAASGDYSALVPYRKPDKPESGPRPQLYDGPEGPVWVTPPQAGQAPGTLPVTDPQGNPISAKKRNTPLTEAQSRGTLFLGQMREAEEAIGGLKFKPNTLTAQAQLAAALKAKEEPGAMKGTLMNWGAGQEAQQYAQAAEQWAEAFLRIKTGAASTRDEVLRNVRTFFPQPGDTAATIKQKDGARAAANKQMEIIAGQGVGQLDAQKGGGKVINWDDLP
jgi:hypothetical protein